MFKITECTEAEEKEQLKGRDARGLRSCPSRREFFIGGTNPTSTRKKKGGIRGKEYEQKHMGGSRHLLETQSRDVFKSDNGE